MDKKKRIEVVINGQAHAFVTSDKEEYIKGLAEYLNDKIAEVSKASFGNLLTNDKKYIVAAMNILDDYYKTLAKYEELNEKTVADSEKNQKIIYEYEKRIKGYENQIKSVQKENAKLTEKLRSVEYEFDYVQNLYKEQKQEFDYIQNQYKEQKQEFDYLQNLYKEQKQEYEELLEKATKPDNK